MFNFLPLNSCRQSSLQITHDCRFGACTCPLRSSVALAEPGKSATVESHVGLWDDLKEYPNMLHVDLFDRLLHLLPSV